MTSKLKKAKSAGRFGARYGKKVRASLVSIEQKQRLKQKCPFCEKVGAKRLSKGVWKCTRKKCGRKFAADAYYLTDSPSFQKTTPSDRTIKAKKSPLAQSKTIKENKQVEEKTGVSRKAASSTKKTSRTMKKTAKSPSSTTNKSKNK